MLPERILSFGRRNIARAVLAVALAALPRVAMAEGEPTPSDTATQQPIVVVAHHYETAIGRNDTASAGTVSGDLLREMPLLRPGEALETIPGLIVTQHSGDGKANQYFLRGYNLDHGTDFASSVDGVPVNMPTNGHGQGYADLNFLIPELVDHIDYNKGTYFAENGDFAAAGSARIHIRDQLDSGIADITGGSHNYWRGLFADSFALAKNDGPHVLVAGEFMRENGPWLTPENLHKTNLLLRASDGNAQRGWSIDIAHYRAAWNSTDQIPLELITTGAVDRFAALDPTDGGRSGRDIVSGEWHHDTGSAFTSAAAFYQNYHLQLWSDFTFYELRHAGAPDPNLPSDQFSQSDARDIIGASLAQGWRHGFLGRDSTTEFGARLRHDAIDVALHDTQSRVAFAAVSDDHITENELGIYAKNTTRWAQWLRSIIGVRLDMVAMSRLARIIPENSGRATAALASPKGSVVFGPFSRTEFFLSAGRGFHSNDARGVIGLIDPTTGGPALRVPALVKAFGKEAGIRTEAVPGLQTSLSVWSLNSDSELVYSADAAIGSTSANAASRRYGIEWNNHYAFGRWWLLDFDYAWTHARYAAENTNGSAGDLIPNAVARVARIGATLHDADHWSLTAEGRYFGAYPLTQDGTLTAPAAFVANIRGSLQTRRRIAVAVEVLNLFNAKYYDIAYGQDYQISPSTPPNPNGITVHPAEPREIRLSLRESF